MNTIADIQEKCKPYIIGEKIFNQYVLKDYLGQGGFGKVFLVDNRAGSFALKVVQNNISMDIRGMETVRNVNSMRLVKFLDYGKTIRGEDCFVMEYVENNMADILQRLKTLDVETACRYFRAIVESLIELERFNIIHRDIKPSNLFILQDVSGNSLVKIGDFATAKFLNRDSVSQSQVMGTIHYMSPEHFKKGGGHTLDRWPAAVILYQMLTGKFVFDGEDPTEIIGAIMMCRPDLSCVQKSFIPFFKKSFAIDPADRHQSAREMLQHFLACREKQAEGELPTCILNADEMKQHFLSTEENQISQDPGSSGPANVSDAFEINRSATMDSGSIPAGQPSATFFHRIISKPGIAVLCTIIGLVVLGAIIRNTLFLVDSKSVNTPGSFGIRAAPVVTSIDNFEQLLDITSDKRPKTFVDNAFIDNPDKTVTDERCGRVWKMVEVNEPISKQSAEVRIEALNSISTEAHPDWRLPTVSELFTLVSKEKLSDHSYLKKSMVTCKRKFWSADYTDAGLVWFVDYGYGIADTNFPDSGYYVLAVRMIE